MKNTVHIGFISVIFIMTMLAFVWLGQIKSTNESVLELVEAYDLKIENAYLMHNAIRTRQVLLLSMLVIDDPFELDDKIQEFYSIAKNYRQARQALRNLPMSQEEQEIHKLLRTQTFSAQPLTSRAAEMFRNGESKGEIIKVINEASTYQYSLFQTLKQFIELQKSEDDVALNFSRKQFDDSVYWVSFFGLFAFFITVLVSHYVAKTVATKNQQLRLTSEDMTSAYKKAEEATVLKSEFLATMSHEIRTPLTAIIGFAETTLFSDQTMEQRLIAIQTIIRSGKHLLHIINDILDLSKVEANKLEIEYVETSLFGLLADIERLEGPSAEEKEISFSINYIYPLPSTIKVDQLRVKQILLNLCNNAIKFTESGHVIINVRTQSDGDGLLFEVNDSGIGISKEQQDVIFKPYRQADSSTTRKFGGTGLGLSLSSLLAKRMGGSLTVVSELGRGSQFEFYLPSEELPDVQIIFNDDSIPIHHKKSINNISTNALSGHILLAEDNVDNQELLLIFLRRIGVDVTIVENGKLAIEAIENHDFDLILMDMRMPVMGGIEAVKILRKQGYKKPIIAITANAMLEDRDNCFDAGCNDFLSKPVDALKLTETLGKYLDVKESEISEKTSLVSSLLENDPEMINLVKRFANALPDTLKEIGVLIENVEWKELSEILHKLKGTGGNFGFEKVSNLAAKMEFQVANQDKGELIKLFSELEESYEQILLGLENS